MNRPTYIDLEPGDYLKEGDQYMTGSGSYRDIPKGWAGQLITDKDEVIRRPVGTYVVNPPKFKGGDIVYRKFCPNTIGGYPAPYVVMCYDAAGKVHIHHGDGSDIYEENQLLPYWEWSKP